MATQSPDTKLPIEADEKSKKSSGFCASPAMQLVVLLFFADWGDRCQISAIVLTATKNIWGVAAGGALVRWRLTRVGYGHLCHLGRSCWGLLGQ